MELIHGKVVRVVPFDKELHEEGTGSRKGKCVWANVNVEHKSEWSVAILRDNGTLVYEYGVCNEHLR